MRKITYFAHYDMLDTPNSRAVNNMAAVNKMNYIFKVLNEHNIDTTVISACFTRLKSHAEEKNIFPNVALKLLPTIKCNKKISRIIAFLIFEVRLLLCLLRELKNGDTLVVYHSLSLINIVNIVAKFRKIDLILEVEEIYGDVLEKEKVSKRELRFFQKAKGYIFASENLQKKVNNNLKPFVIINGTYDVEPNKGKIFTDDKIHIVYAGTFEPRKGSAVAVSIAEFLDCSYHIHIIGFGTEKDKENLLLEIEKVKTLSKCNVTYDGRLSGEEYLKFIQSCDIGLSPQDPNATFNATSFPSKILSYMANGLRVVSIRIPAIESSAIGDYMYYYDVQTPEEIAKVIKKIDINNEYNGKEIISTLHKKFSNDILQFLKEVKDD